MLLTLRSANPKPELIAAAPLSALAGAGRSGRSKLRIQNLSDLISGILQMEPRLPVRRLRDRRLNRRGQRPQLTAVVGALVVTHCVCAVQAIGDHIEVCTLQIAPIRID